MKEYTFPYYVSFGKNDSVNCEIDIELSDEDADRLEKSAHEEPRFRLDEDDKIGDIYDMVYQTIIDQEKDSLLDDPSPVEDTLSWDEDYDPDVGVTEKDIDAYLDELSFGVNYPEELQELDEDDWEDENELPDWEDYPGNCRFALETINNTVLEFTEAFRKEVFEKAKACLDAASDISINYEELCGLLDVSDESGEIVFNKRSHSNMDSFDGTGVLELLHELEYELEFEGMTSRFGHFGVEVIR